MADKRSVDDLTTEELEQVLAIRRREERLRRLRRLEDEGRVIAAGPQEQSSPPPLPRPEIEPVGAIRRYQSAPVEEESQPRGGWSALPRVPARLASVDLRRILNRLLLVVEIGALVALIWIMGDLWQTRQMLNREAAQVQQGTIGDSFPTPSPTALIDVVLLPGGHTSPLSAGGHQQGEAGDIPEHLLPLVSAYSPPPIPTPGPEHAVRIVISAIDVDHPIVQGDEYEQLKKGVGQHIGSANPGAAGNMVLTAHNDIYGEIFRRLDDLVPGDEIVVYTMSRRYVYSVQFTQVVEPWDVTVMAPTRTPVITLISCYPYLVDTQRIVVIGALEAEL